MKISQRGADFVLVEEIHPPPRIELARERMLLCRLYLGLIRSINEDYGASFAGQNDSSTFRTIGIYVFLRTVMCSPVGASKIASASTPTKERRILDSINDSSGGCRPWHPPPIKSLRLASALA